MNLVKIAVAASLLVLGGCATFGGQKATVVSANPSSVTVRYKEGKLADASARANELCGQYGRRAVMQRVSPTGSDQLGSFDCEPET